MKRFLIVSVMIALGIISVHVQSGNPDEVQRARAMGIKARSNLQLAGTPATGPPKEKFGKSQKVSRCL